MSERILPKKSLSARMNTGGRAISTAALAIIALVLPTMIAQADDYEINNKTQSHFEWCFNSTITSDAMKNRFRDGIAAWKIRSEATSDQESCSNSAALTVRKQTIDERGGTIARVERNALGNAVHVTFGDEEDWWTGTGQPDCGTVDFWGTAAHEVGHIWGLSHPADEWAPPNSALVTMSTGQPVYDCPEIREKKRDLTSDDEAGIRRISGDSIMPNPSFERNDDCSAAIRCVDAFYWEKTGTWERVCGSTEAYQGNCFMKINDAGTIRQKIRYYGGYGTLQFRVKQTSSSTSTSVQVKLHDITNGVDDSGSCNIEPGTGWQVCEKFLSSGSCGCRHLMEWVIDKNSTGRTLKIDSVRLFPPPYLS